MKILIISTFLLIFREIYAMNFCPIDFCNSTEPSHNETEVQKYCNNVGDGHMIERCCFVNNTVVGLDLSACEIKSLNISSNNFTDVVIMDLRDNDLGSIVPKDVIGLIELEYLYLPSSISCPGGEKAWNRTSTNLNDTYCFHQNNPCVYLNISCTENGICKHLGPGSAKCVCIPGHYGYKCMNKGEFPSTVFAVSVSVSTIVLSIVLWFAHGRDASKKG